MEEIVCSMTGYETNLLVPAHLVQWMNDDLVVSVVDINITCLFILYHVYVDE